MSYTNPSLYMGLPIPSVGLEPGPDFASDINNCLTIIDQHNHDAGSGQQITPSGLNINADLPLNSNNLTLARSLRMVAQSAALALSTDLRCLYAVGADLYYNDGSGNQVRMTQSGAVAGTPGSIANLVSPASAAYVSASSTFVFQSASLTPGNLDGASVILRNLSASSFGLTLAPPAAMGANYTVTLPALPASTLLMTLSSSGAMSTMTTEGLTQPGTIIMFGGASAPTGYLACDGSSVLRASYPALFTAIGTAWGSADGTHFNLPDLRGQFPRGVDGGAGKDPDAASRTACNAGGNTGDNVGSIQAGALASHTHTLVNANNSQVAGGANTSAAYNGGSTPITITTSATGGNETRPTNAYVNFCIKT